MGRDAVMMNETHEVREYAGLHYLLRPARQSHDAAAPLLVFLHGYDEGAPMPIDDALTRHGPLRPGNPRDVLDPFAIVAPQLPRRGDLWHEFAGAVESLVRHVQAKEETDVTRTYLTGFSFGGNGVFDLGLRDSGLWAALWVVDPTRVPSGELQLPIWFAFGEIARHRKAQFLQALNLSPADESDGDRVFIDDGSDHVGAATNAYRDARTYRWLVMQSRINSSVVPCDL